MYEFLYKLRYVDKNRIIHYKNSSHIRCICNIPGQNISLKKDSKLMREHFHTFISEFCSYRIMFISNIICVLHVFFWVISMYMSL